METNQTLFNSGIAKLQRIDELKQGYHVRYIEERDYLKCLDYLDDLWGEIVEKLDEKEYKEVSELYLKTRKLIEDSSKTRGGANIIKDTLRRLSHKLNILEYKYGFGMPDMPSKKGAYEA